VAGNARHRNRLSTPIKRRPRIVYINTVKPSSKVVGVALAPGLTISDDIETRIELIPNGKHHCIALSLGQISIRHPPQFLRSSPRRKSSSEL
jgi:hypothetical protein